MINPDDLKYFLEASRARNFSRAAERLGITQPALSHSIKRLEQILKTRLFIRSKRGVELSHSGQLLFEKSSSFIQNWIELQRCLEDDEKIPKGIIKLGCHSAVAQYVLPQFLPKFLKSYPLIKFEFEHGLSRHMTERVFSSQLDVAIAINPLKHADLVIRELCTDQVSLWRHKKCHNPRLLMYEPGLSQTQEILRHMKSLDLQFDSFLESSSLELIARLLASRTACAILPKRVVDLIDSNQIERVEGAPIILDKLCLLYRPEFRMTERGRVFAMKLKEYFEKH